MVAMEALFHGVPVVAAGYQWFGRVTPENLAQATACNFGDAVSTRTPVSAELLQNAVKEVLHARNSSSGDAELAAISARLRGEHSIDVVARELENAYAEAIQSAAQL